MNNSMTKNGIKRLFLLTFLLCSFGYQSLDAQVINTFPYSYDFENESQGPINCSNPYTMSQAGWLNDLGDDVDWTADLNGTLSGNTGPSNDHTPTGSGYYMYIETSSGCTNRTANLLSPYFDFTAVPAPEFSFWYHMYGATMGTLRLEATVGTTGTWTTVWGPTTSNQNSWQQATLNLATYGGQDSIRFRFRGVTGTSYTSDIAIDDISVISILPDDAGVTALINPAPGSAA